MSDRKDKSLIDFLPFHQKLPYTFYFELGEQVLVVVDF